NTTRLPLKFNKSFKTTSLFKISLPFWVWMNCLKKISSLSNVLVRFNVSCLNLSLLPKSSPVTKVVLSSSKIPFAPSRKSWLVSTITCLKTLSTCKVISMMFKSVLKNSPRNWLTS
ncbi:hypothetical protein CU097_001006, partial [Rhizopus azygosporus]